MTDVVRLDGDYKIVTKANGVITMDVGSTGTVRVTGNLDILGATTTIETTDTSIKDNIIVLNQGQSLNGSGQAQISSGQGLDYGKSGIIIDRGADANRLYRASLLFDNNKQGFVIRSDNNPTLLYGVGLRLDTDGLESSYYVNGRPRLYFSGVETPNVVLSVGEESAVQDYSAWIEANGMPNDIPNKQYVDDKFANTSVDIATTATSLKKYNSFINISNSALGGAGRISTFIDDYLVMQVEQNSVQMADLGIEGSTISPVFTNTNLFLTTHNADVEVQSGMSFQVPTYSPVGEVNKVKVYSTSTTGAGGTGLMFVNNQGQDELVSAKKALIFSIIF
jgi:hypothetical protein